MSTNTNNNNPHDSRSEASSSTTTTNDEEEGVEDEEEDHSCNSDDSTSASAARLISLQISDVEEEEAEEEAEEGTEEGIEEETRIRRGGWTLGTVDDRYRRYDTDRNDILLGRIAAMRGRDVVRVFSENPEFVFEFMLYLRDRSDNEEKKEDERR